MLDWLQDTDALIQLLAEATGNYSLDFALALHAAEGIVTQRIFLASGATIVLIALLTVSYHAVRTALADPVDSLRYE